MLLQIPDEIWDKIDPEHNDVFRSLSTLYKSDDEALRDFIVWHGKSLQAERERAEPLFEQYKQEFASKLRHAVEEQGLPLDLEQLETRMQDVGFAICDPLVMQLESLGGYYDVRSRTVSAALTDPVRFKKVVFHELMHHISRQAASTSYTDPSNPSMGRADTIFSTGMIYSNGTRVPMWINEAVTEQLAQIFLSASTDFDFSKAIMADFFANKKGTYGLERDVLSVVASELSLHTMLKAYFEDSIPTPGGDPVAATRAFWKSAVDKYGLDVVEIIETERGTLKDSAQARRLLTRFSRHTGVALPDVLPSEIALVTEATTSAALRSIFGQ
ncbi:MAG: hypothetical protein WBO35_01835 [Candidatus Saccharimonadales bacterium]